ncbi:NHL repeat-containing protein [Paenibacillus senegalensis]|uniref:hypothetical protein n=1 Tax=Paenibacillus senegalensis TaxID=1465766 RepID=UPI00028A1155|nr:hypothetical protein [Paenibacillus senegalensis]
MSTAYRRRDLGEAVKIALSQGAVFTAGEDESPVLCLVLNGHPAALVKVSVETGRVLYSHKLPDTEAVTAVVSVRHEVYLAGPKKLFRYNPLTDELTELGAIPCESVIVWDLAVGADGRLYGVGYPGSFMFAYDPLHCSFTDLGTMKPGEDYARGIVSSGDMLYIGIGASAHAVAYRITDGSMRELPFELAGQPHTVKKVYPADDRLLITAGSQLWICDRQSGLVLRTLRCDGAFCSGPAGEEQVFYYKSDRTLCRYDAHTDIEEQLDESFAWPETEIKAWSWIHIKRGPLAGKQVLAGMAAFTEIVYYDLATGRCGQIQSEVEGQGVPVQSLHCDPEGRIIAGGYHRGMSIYDPGQAQWMFTSPQFRQIEGMLNHGGRVYFGTYRHAHIYHYDPSKPFAGEVDSKQGNPGFCFAPGELQDRPFVFASGEKEWYAGTIPDYGQLGGALIAFKTAKRGRAEEQGWTEEQERTDEQGRMEEQVRTEAQGRTENQVRTEEQSRTKKTDPSKQEEEEAENQTEEIWVQRHVIPNQSIIGLAYRNGMLYGGTSIYGGLGVAPAAEEARLFVWDTRQRQVIRQIRLVIAGEFVRPKLIGALSFGPDGLLWGAADIDGLLFAMDPGSLEAVKWKRLYPAAKPGSRWRPYYLFWDREGRLWTTAGRHISRVDPDTMEHEQVVAGADVMTLGQDGTVYYASGSQLIALCQRT